MCPCAFRRRDPIETTDSWITCAEGYQTLMPLRSHWTKTDGGTGSLSVRHRRASLGEVHPGTQLVHYGW